MPEQVPLLFVPGLSDIIPDNFIRAYASKETGRSSVWDYNPLNQIFAAAGYCPTYLQPAWAGSTVEVWENDVIAAAKWLAAPGEAVLLSGFSYGALLAMRAARRLGTAHGPQIRGVLAIEPSCNFGGEIELDGVMVHPLEVIAERHPEEIALFNGSHPDGSRRLYPGAVEDLKKHGVSDPGCPVQVYSSDEAFPVMQAAAEHITKLCAIATLIKLPGELHSPVHPETLKAIAQNIGQFATG